MTTITIPKKLINQKDLIVVPREEYEEFLEFKKIFPVAELTRSELRAIKQGRKEAREGKISFWRDFKHELAHNSNR